MSKKLSKREIEVTEELLVDDILDVCDEVLFEEETTGVHVKETYSWPVLVALVEELNDVHKLAGDSWMAMDPFDWIIDFEHLNASFA